MKNAILLLVALFSGSAWSMGKARPAETYSLSFLGRAGRVALPVPGDAYPDDVPGPGYNSAMTPRTPGFDGTHYFVIFSENLTETARIYDLEGAQVAQLKLDDFPLPNLPVETVDLDGRPAFLVHTEKADLWVGDDGKILRQLPTGAGRRIQGKDCGVDLLAKDGSVEATYPGAGSCEYPVATAEGDHSETAAVFLRQTSDRVNHYDLVSFDEFGRRIAGPNEIEGISDGEDQPSDYIEISPTTLEWHAPSNSWVFSKVDRFSFHNRGLFCLRNCTWWTADRSSVFFVRRNGDVGASYQFPAAITKPVGPGRRGWNRLTDGSLVYFANDTVYVINDRYGSLSLKLAGVGALDSLVEPRAGQFVVMSAGESLSLVRYQLDDRGSDIALEQTLDLGGNNTWDDYRGDGIYDLFDAGPDLIGVYRYGSQPQPIVIDHVRVDKNAEAVR